MSLLTVIALNTMLVALPQKSSEAKDVCTQIVGTWTGEHTFKDGMYRSWEVQLKPGGVYLGAFYDQKGSVVNQYSGSWKCKDREFYTEAKTKRGKLQVYLYRVLDVTETNMRYQPFKGKKNGPVFNSKREQ